MDRDEREDDPADPLPLAGFPQENPYTPQGEGAGIAAFIAGLRRRRSARRVKE